MILQNLRCIAKVQKLLIEIYTINDEFAKKNAKISTYSTFLKDSLLKYWGLMSANACKSCRSRQELFNEYLLAKVGFDTAENEPFEICWYQPTPWVPTSTALDAVEELAALAELQDDVVALAVLVAVVDAADVRVVQGELQSDLGKEANEKNGLNLLQTLRGSSSAVSTPIFESKY